MQITDVYVKKFEQESRVKANISITLDNEFVVRGIKVIETPQKLLVTMPRRKTPSGEFKDVAHPINAEFRAKIEEAVLKAYEEAEVTTTEAKSE